MKFWGLNFWRWFDSQMTALQFDIVWLTKCINYMLGRFNVFDIWCASTGKHVGTMWYRWSVAQSYSEKNLKKWEVLMRRNKTEFSNLTKEGFHSAVPGLPNVLKFSWVTLNYTPLLSHSPWLLATGDTWNAKIIKSSLVYDIWPVHFGRLSG